MLGPMRWRDDRRHRRERGRRREQHRIGWFIDRLRESKESVSFFHLTLESLSALVLLPAKDEPVFIALMKKRLGLHSYREPIAAVL